MRIAFADEGRDGGIAGEAAVPIGLAVDLDRRNMVGRHAEASSTSGVISALRKIRPRPVWTLVAVMNSLIGDAARRSKSMLSARTARSGLKPMRIEIVGREHARHQIDGR